MASLTETGYTKLYDVTAAKDSFLKNPDLIAMTFSHFSHLQVDDEKRRCLLNAALTCKDFLDEALDALWEKMDSMVPLLKLLPALQVEDGAYVLSGNVSQADWDRLQYYSRKVKFFEAMYDNDQPHVHSLTYFRIAQLQSSALFPSLRRLCYDLGDPSIPHIFLFLSPLLNSLELFNINGFEDTIVGPFLATLSSPMLSRVVLRNGAMSVDIFKKSVVHFTQLRSLELLDAVIMNGFDLWKVLGTLPSLANFTLRAVKPHRCLIPRPTPGNSSSQNQSGGPKYFDALESLSVKGSFFLIQHLLGFIDSSCLKSIEVYPVIKHDHEDEGFFTPCMTIVASKWSQSLKNLYISSRSFGVPHNAISKCLMLLTDLHEIQSFHLRGWRLENMDDDVRRLVMSWPKLRVLNLGQTLISLSTTRIIAENCPELHFLHIQLDISTFPPFDASCRRLTHNLAVLNVAGFYPSDSTIIQTPECQIQMTRHLDSIFPYLKSIEVRDETWLDIYNLVKSRFCQDDRRVKPATDMVLSST